MTVRALKGSIFTTMGICLAAGFGLAAAPAAAWAQASPSAPDQPSAGGPAAAAAVGSSSGSPGVAPVQPTIPGQTMPVAATGGAQGRASVDERGYAITRSTQETVKARYLVQVMEGVLERAVKYAATQMNRRLQAVSPDLLQLSGAARARGFRLDGYGVFFDVEVPAALRQTMSWTYRTNMPNDRTLEQALTALRKANSALEGKQRSEADTALKLIELKVRPDDLAGGLAYGPSLDRRGGGSGASVAATNIAAGDAAAPAAPGGGALAGSGGPQHGADTVLTENPDITYEMEVRDALVGAMLAYGTTLTLQPEEWLTIAARDNQNVIVPGDLSETVTVILRIKGSDLAEYKAGRLDETAARRRVEVREF